MRSRIELIRELSERLGPAPRLRGPRELALLWWIGAWVFVVAATVVVQPLRPGFAGQLLASPRFAGETLLGIAAGAFAIGVAFAVGIPGWGSPRRRIALALGLLALWASTYLYGLVDPALEPAMLGKRALCFAEVLIYGLPILIVGLLLLRRLAPLEVWSAGLVSGAAAGAVPALLMQVACMYIPAHILTHHVAPALALALVGSLAGRLLLRRI
ncbi:MAG: NrsF family protein [Planctomycetota bacterium]